MTNLYPNPLHPQRATFNHQQFRALAQDHLITVISPVAWTEELAARRTSSARIPEGRRQLADGILVEYPRSFFIPRYLRGLYGQCLLWSIRRAFQRKVREFRPNVVLATWAYPDGWAAVELAHRARLPVALKVHGSDILELEKHPGRRRGTIEALQRADRIVAVSRNLAQRVIELGAREDRVHLIYNGVDDALFCPGEQAISRAKLGVREGKRILLYVGNLVPVKGTDVLLDACGRLDTRKIDFELHIIGKGPMRIRLEQQSRERGIRDRVIFHGPIPHDKLPDWFRAADLLVLPSRSEGVPNVLLEAAACGTPFVASRVGGVPEVAHHGACRLVSPGDAVELCNVIEEYLKNPQVKSPASRGRTHDKAASELGCLLTELVSRRVESSNQTLFLPTQFTQKASPNYPFGQQSL